MQSWPLSLLNDGNDVHWVHAVRSRVDSGFLFTDRVIDDHVLWFCVDGACEIRTDGATLSMRSGGLMWMPPGERHSAWIPARMRPFLAYSFRFRFSAPSPSRRFAHTAIMRTDGRECEDLLRRLLDDLGLADAASPMRSRATLYLVYTALMRSGVEERVQRGFTAHERIQLARYVSSHLAHHPAPADLARELGLGSERFLRLFKATYGMPPRRWLLEQRIAEARFRLSQANEPIGVIAESIGYSDRHLFNRQFKALVGRTPRAFRISPR
jgi:AraC-like DNA-binding protein